MTTLRPLLSLEWGVEYIDPDRHHFVRPFRDRDSAERELDQPIPSECRAYRLAVRMVTDWAPV